jgi:hypothetical protein
MLLNSITINQPITKYNKRKRNSNLPVKKIFKIVPNKANVVTVKKINKP